MVILQDVDMIMKCAECGFFDQLPELLGCRDSDIRILPSSRFVIRKRFVAESQVVETALNFCQEHEVVPALEDEALFDRIRAERIEEGEALLFALAVEGEAHVFTGDKRAVKALYARMQTLNEILQALKGRVICFEEILLRFYERNGFEELRRSCVRSRDKMLMQCFSNGVVTREEDAIFGIRSNYRDLLRNSGDLLVKRDLPLSDPA